MFKNALYIFLATIVSTISAGPQHAIANDGTATARQGIVRCAGTHFLRGPGGGTERHWAVWNLHNFDLTTPIVIDRMVIVNAAGSIIFDSAVSGLPDAGNGLLGPTNNILRPNQTANFQSRLFLPALPQSERPVQFVVIWSAANPAITLHVTAHARITEYDPSNPNALGSAMAGHGLTCRAVQLVP